LAALAARGITRVLVEGGAELAASLLRQRLVDRLAWFRAPMLLGGDGQAAIAALGVDALAQALTAQPAGGASLAGDSVERYIIEAG
jgi:diaminohydroxyphosphoribosylaminopyrimidine deaminase/5-amino-6-(5-phosphoribosylamino)uracil reductase